MKIKHMLIRIEQCRTLSMASNCVRAKYGAMLLDPLRNVVLMDGYNGAPRGGGELCGGSWCCRNGLTAEDLSVTELSAHLSHSVQPPYDGWPSDVVTEPGFYVVHTSGQRMEGPFPTARKASHAIPSLLAKSQPHAFGHAEVGCHHAEMNVICNAAATGTACSGAWLFVTGEPCLMCAKLIHHSGISRVIVIADGYGSDLGVNYLHVNGVAVEHLTHEQVNEMARSLREENRRSRPT